MASEWDGEWLIGSGWDVYTAKWDEMLSRTALLSSFSTHIINIYNIGPPNL